MADWDKLKNKIGANADGPTPADWEAMQAKIAAQPALAPVASKNSWFSWLVAGLIGLMLGMGSLYFWPRSSGESGVGNSESSLEAPLPENSNQTTVGIPDADRDVERQEGPSMGSSELEIDPNLKEEGQESGYSAVAFTNDSEANIIEADQEEEAVSTLNTQEGNALNTTFEADRSRAAERTFENRGPINQQAEEMAEGSEPIATDFNDQGELNSGATIGKPENNSAASDQNSELDMPNQSDSSQEEETTDEIKASTEAEAGTNEEPKLAPEEEEDEFIRKESGFELNRISLFAGLQNDLKSNSLWAYGSAAELQWQKRHQFFSVGLGYYRVEQPYKLNLPSEGMRIDSIWQTNIQDREVIEVSRQWVIDSFQAGHYVYDTTRRIVSDTTINLRVDTNQYRTNIVNQRVRAYYYAELPLLYGYQMGKGNWQFQLAGGLALQQVLAYSEDESGSQSLFGMSALLQPGASWRFSDRWSVLGRVQLRYPLQQDFVLYDRNELRYSFQLGVSYRW
ncbi:ICP22 family protein [Croceimicrobium hydrocarbonivorans]|uniref:Outer membrane protein beta-barrel domain-containing protein n=1 Tax=Croceimicrobium hydrocarbonivorans TaxID=2761580 RepID=A0A7H0VC08_9FLAO|nr:hypothetical protein [Croceimicrobium hydrocarbonivorans]QNR23256.1 hypothetical protein H4K34_12840 [Croceimicrobium hydrocarbonivorans]